MSIRVPSLYVAGVAFVAGVGSAGLLMSPAPKGPSADNRATFPAQPATPIQAASTVDPNCRDAAWPYTSPQCSAAGPDRPVRQVRVIPTGREPQPSLAVADASPAAPPVAAAPAPSTVAVSARPAERGLEPAVTGSTATKLADAVPATPVAIGPASLGPLDERSPIGPAPSRADAQPSATPRVAQPAPAPASQAKVGAGSVLALNEAPPVLRGTGAVTTAEAVPPGSNTSLAPADRGGGVAEPVSDYMSLTSVQPDRSSPLPVMPAASPQPGATRIATAAQDVIPVPPEGPRDTVAAASTRPPERVAERSPEPASTASELARAPDTNTASAASSLPLPPPAERSVVARLQAESITPPAAAQAAERQEPRVDRKAAANRRERERERVAARADRAPERRADMPRVDAPRSREPVDHGREPIRRLADGPSGRPLQVLRLRVYDYPDGTRLAVNPRTGETYTVGPSRRAEARGGSIMSWLAGDPD